MTHDTWHKACDMWHVTWDTWHVTHAGGWTFSQSFNTPSLMVLDRQCLEDSELINDSMSSEGVYRTAPATPGLLKKVGWGPRPIWKKPNRNWFFSGWLSLAGMAGNGRKLLEIVRMAENGWKSLETVGNGWKWLKIARMAGIGWKWPQMAGMAWNDWKWLEIAWNWWK